MYNKQKGKGRGEHRPLPATTPSSGSRKAYQKLLEKEHLKIVMPSISGTAPAATQRNTSTSSSALYGSPSSDLRSLKEVKPGANRDRIGNVIKGGGQMYAGSLLSGIATPYQNGAAVSRTRQGLGTGGNERKQTTQYKERASRLKKNWIGGNGELRESAKQEGKMPKRRYGWATT